MEVQGGNERKIHVLAYECIGTIFFTYATMVSGAFSSATVAKVSVIVPVGIEAVYACLLAICWHVSGGHFNPALTMSTFVA